MKQQIRQLETLDKLFRVRHASKNGCKRYICKNGKRRDAVGRILAGCQTPSEIGAVAVVFGIGPKEVIRRGRNAPNFGQFRMVCGNRIRGELGKMAFRLLLRRDDSFAPESSIELRG